MFRAIPLSSGTVLGQLLDLTFQIELQISIQNNAQRNKRHAADGAPSALFPTIGKVM
jgi:hypothetical protein